MRVGTNGEIYRQGVGKSRGFTGNQWVKTYGVAKIGARVSGVANAIGLAATLGKASYFDD
jgi:hypothetical protein